MGRRPERSRRRRARRLLAGLTLVAVVTGACNAIDPIDPSLDARFLTTQSNDDISVTLGAGGAITVAAPAGNAGNGSRALVWRRADPVAADQQVCVSWSDPPDQDLHQAGVALRVRPVDGGGASAVTVTRNVIWGAFWGFNVHVWNGRLNPDIRQIAGFLLPDAVQRGTNPPRTAPFPWRLCARVQGNVLTFKVWAADLAEPAWGDTRFGASVTLPAGYSAAGHGGGYVGHVSPGSRFTLTDLVVGPPG